MAGSRESAASVAAGAPISSTPARAAPTKAPRRLFMTCSSIRRASGGDLGVGGDSGLEHAVGIRDGDLDAEDQVHALLLRLHVARRVLGGRADLADGALEATARERIDRDRGRLPDLHATDVGLGKIGAQPHVARPTSVA